MKLVTPRRIGVALILIACAAGLVIAANHTDSGEPDIIESGDSTIVEQLTPQAGSSVLRQTPIGIDMSTGWTAVLIVNGTEIPEDQLHRVPALNQVFFTPGPGTAIEQLPPGSNCVDAIIWRENQTRADARPPLRWCFDVT